MSWNKHGQVWEVVLCSDGQVQGQRPLPIALSLQDWVKADCECRQMYARSSEEKQSHQMDFENIILAMVGG